MNKKTYDIAGKKKLWLIISAALFVIIAVLTVMKGTEIAIEFKGGTIVSYSYTGDINTNDIDKAMQEILNTPVTIQSGENISGDTRNVTVSFSYDDGLSEDTQNKMLEKLQSMYPDGNVEQLESNDVNPTSGREFFLKCVIAAIIAAALIIGYIAWRFKKISGWSAGICAIVALLHDLVIVFGSFILFGYEINANFIAVILTILGYSVNNTIVVYDRIRENQKILKGASVAELVNVSDTQTLKRSIRTSVTTVATMLIVSIVAYIYGVSSILSFSVPLIFGMISGTYSSICIAPSLWVWWYEKRKNKKKSKK